MNKLLSFSIGFFVATLANIYVFHSSPLMIETKEAIKLCEKELPRTQHCIIAVVPENTK